MSQSAHLSTEGNERRQVKCTIQVARNLREELSRWRKIYVGNAELIFVYQNKYSLENPKLDS